LIPKNFIRTYMKYDVGISVIKRPFAIFRPFDDMELFNAPYFQAYFLSNTLPSCFILACLFSNVLLEL